MTTPAAGLGLKSPQLARTAWAALRITRPHNCLGGAAAAALGFYLAKGSTGLLGSEGGSAVLVVALGIAVGNIANDCQDADVDAISKSHRPIPSGAISVANAISLAGFFSVALVAVVWTLGLVPLIFALCAVPLGVLYSVALKNTVLLGNVAVGVVSASSVSFGGVVAGRTNASVLLASALVFLFVLSREILKTIADQDADGAAGLQTVATKWGLERAYRAFNFVNVVFLLTALSAAVSASHPGRYLALTSGLVLAPSAALLTLLYRSRTNDRVQATLRATKVMWFTGLIAMAMLR